MKEELGIEGEVGKFISASRAALSCTVTIELQAYYVSHLSGDFMLNDHAEIAWVAPEELKDYDFPPADRPIIEILMKMVQ